MSLQEFQPLHTTVRESGVLGTFIEGCPNEAQQAAIYGELAELGIEGGPLYHNEPPGSSNSYIRLACQPGFEGTSAALAAFKQRHPHRCINSAVPNATRYFDLLKGAFVNIRFRIGEDHIRGDLPNPDDVALLRDIPEVTGAVCAPDSEYNPKFGGAEPKYFLDVGMPDTPDSRVIEIASESAERAGLFLGRYISSMTVDTKNLPFIVPLLKV